MLHFILIVALFVTLTISDIMVRSWNLSVVMISNIDPLHMSSLDKSAVQTVLPRDMRIMAPDLRELRVAWQRSVLRHLFVFHTPTL
jgi:hypothetical protein